jgi:hypothetical protein
VVVVALVRCYGTPDGGGSQAGAAADFRHGLRILDPEAVGSTQDVLNEMTFDVGEAALDAVVLKGESFVIEP